MVKEKLRQHLLTSQKRLCSEEELQSWFDPLIIIHNNYPPNIHVNFPHSFFEHWFTKMFQTTFEETSYELWGHNLTFTYGKVPLSQKIYRQKNQQTPPVTKKNLTIEQRFETFIVNGKYNWIISIIQNMIQEKIVENSTLDQETQLLILFGQEATGKTHLLRATAQRLSIKRHLQFIYTSTDELASLLIKKPLFLFREELQKYQYILIDDFQRISNYLELQSEFRILLDHCKDNKKTIFISGTSHPLNWNLSKEIYSRLEVGLWAELPEPDLDIRLRYAQQISKEKKYAQPKEHLLIIAQHCHNMRCISGVLQRVMTHQSLINRNLSEKDLLTIIKQAGERTELSPQTIIMLVGENYGFSLNDIIGEGRQKDLVLARQLAMYLCRELLGYSYPVIGRFFGGKDHTTVIHSIKKIKILQDSSRVIHTMIKELTQKCQKIKKS